MSKDNSTKYFDELIKHSISAEYYGNTISGKAESDIEDLEEELEEILLENKSVNTKSDVNSISSKINKDVDRFINALKLFLIASMSSAVSRESDWFKKLIEKYTAASCAVPENIFSFLEYSPYDSKNTVQSFLSSLSQKIKTVYKNAIKSGYAFGYSTEDLAKTAKQNMNAVVNDVKLNTQEIGSSAVKNTERVILGKNEKLFEGYQWCAILDSSTCIVCGDLDGTIFKTVEDAPVIPVHERCRCTLIPLVEGSGYGRETYTHWLARQDMASQRKILGKTRYELYKKGLPVNRFVNDDKTRKLTLDEIYDENKDK